MSNEIVVSGGRALSKSAARLKWEQSTPAARTFAVIFSAGFLFAGFTWASSQFFQIRGVQHVLTSRIFLALTWLFATLAVWGMAWVFFYGKRYVIGAIGAVVLLIGAVTMDHQFPMLKSTTDRLPTAKDIAEEVAKRVPARSIPDKEIVQDLPKLEATVRAHKAASMQKRPEEIPDLELTIFNPTYPAPHVRCTTKVVAYNIEISSFLWNLDGDVSKTLDIQVSKFDFLRSDQDAQGFALLSDNDAKNKVRDGNRIFGFIQASCPRCQSIKEYWIYFTWGKGGWYAQLPPGQHAILNRVADKVAQIKLDPDTSINSIIPSINRKDIEGLP